MQNSCPSCGAMYNLTPQHVGRHFGCKKCGASLSVGPDGLEIEGAAPVQPIGSLPELGIADEPLPAPAPAATPVRTGPRSNFGSNFGAFFKRLWERIKADPPTWLFGAGAFLVVICLFFPLLDKDKVERRRVKLTSEEREQNRLNNELQTRDPPAKPEERETRQKAFERWKKNRKPELEEDITSAQDSARSWRYWYDWGMMWGFMILAFASLGYLTAPESMTRRVVGSIVLCAILVLIFFRFVYLESSLRSVEGAADAARQRIEGR